MRKHAIDYLHGIYETAIKRHKEADQIENQYSRGFFKGYHRSTMDLCEQLASIEGFSFVEQAGEGEVE